MPSTLCSLLLVILNAALLLSYSLSLLPLALYDLSGLERRHSPVRVSLVQANIHRGRHTHFMSFPFTFARQAKLLNPLPTGEGGTVSCEIYWTCTGES